MGHSGSQGNDSSGDEGFLGIRELHEAAIQHREFSCMLCDDLEGWVGGGWEGRSRGRGYIYTYD